MDRISQPCAAANATTKYRPTNENSGLLMQGEQILGIVYNADGVVGRLSLLKTYDLIFTDRRLVGAVVAKTGAASVIGGSLGGAIGGFIPWSEAEGRANKGRANYIIVPAGHHVPPHYENVPADHDPLTELQLQ